MGSISALILTDQSRGRLRFAGRDLTDHAVLAATRAGIERVARTVVPELPFATAWWTDVVLVLSPATIVEHSTLIQLLAKVSLGPGEAAVVDVNGKSVDIILLSRGALANVRGARRVEDALQHLARLGMLHAVALGPRFCARVDDGTNIARLERAYWWARIRSWFGSLAAAVVTNKNGEAARSPDPAASPFTV